MKRILTYAVAVTLAAVSAISCSKEKYDFPIAFAIQTTGSVSGDTFTEDNGTVYSITEVLKGVEVSDMDRALACFDILKKTGDKSYSIRLLSLYKPLCKDKLDLSKASEEELAYDPVMLEEGWISGGYINLRFLLSHIKDSETLHLINLVYDDTQPADTLRFTLRHNGYGEGFAHEGDRSNFTESAGFVCFNVSGMVPEGMESIPVKITAPWYETVGEDVRTGDTIDLVTRGVLKR